MKTSYNIPLSGTYSIIGGFIQLIPTDRFELQTNENRKWFQFWKPKKTLQRIYEKKILHIFNEIKHFEAGEKFIVTPSYEITRLAK